MRRGLVKSLKHYLLLIYTGTSWRRKLLFELIITPKVFWACSQYRIFFRYFCTFENLKRESVRVGCPETLKAHSPEAAVLWNNGTHSAVWIIFIYEWNYRFWLDKQDKPINDKTTVRDISSGTIKRCVSWGVLKSKTLCSNRRFSSLLKAIKQRRLQPGPSPLASINRWLRSIKCNCSPEWPTSFFNGTFGHHKLLKERTQVAILCNQSQLGRQGALPGGGWASRVDTSCKKMQRGCD